MTVANLIVSVEANLARLSEASRQKDVSELLAVYQAITGIAPPRKKKQSEIEMERLMGVGVDEEAIKKKANEPSVDPRTIFPDLFIMCAETAIELGKEGIANRCLEQFRLTNPAKSQFMCRAHLCQAHLEFLRATGQWGEPYVAQLLLAIKSVLAAIEVATSQAAYLFLVHNATVVYNKVCRPLLRDGYRPHLLESMVAIEAAMAEVPPAAMDVELHFLHLLNTISVADEAKSNDAMLKAIAKATAMAKAGSDLPHELRRRLVAAIVQTSAADPKKADSFANELGGLRAKGDEWVPFGSALVILQKVSAGLEENVRASLLSALDACEAPMPVAQGDEGGGKGKKGKKAAKKGKKKKKDDDDDDSGKEVDLHQQAAVACVGRLAVRHKLLDIAKHCANYTLASKALGLQRAWILSEFTTAQVQVCEKEGSMEFFADPGVAALKPRLECLRKLDATLRSAIRFGDEETIHEGCLAIWNTALPLLQPAYRDHAGRAFQSALSAMEDIDSPLYELRVQMHLEQAKIQLDSDFLDQASSELQKACLLDYTIPRSKLPDNGDAMTPEQLALAMRPYDRAIAPIQQKLELRSNIYVDPETDEEKAILQVGQAKDAKTTAMKKQLLGKAVNLLIPPPPPNVKKSKIQPRAFTRLQQKARALIWADIIKLAWNKTLKSADQAVVACDELINITWDNDTDRLLILDQINALFVRAEIAYKEMGTEGPDLEASRNKLIESLVAAHRMGTKLGEEWVSVNAAVDLWNMNLADFHNVALLEATLSAGGTPPCDISPALKEAAIELFQATAELSCTPAYLIRDLGTGLARVHELSGEPDQAIEVCGKVAGRVASVDKKNVLAILTRAHKKLGKDPELPEDRLGEALMLLEKLRCPLFPEETNDATLTALLTCMLGEEAVQDDGKKGKGAAKKAKPKSAGKKKDDGPVVELPAATESKEEVDELEAEVWAFVTLACLQHERLHDVLLAADASLKPLAALTASGGKQDLKAMCELLPFGALRWRHYSMVECVAGETLSRMVDPTKQDKKSQDVIRQNALVRFERAALYALLSVLNTPTATSMNEPVSSSAPPRHPPAYLKPAGDVRAPAGMLVLKCAKHFWNVAVPFMNSTATRQVIQQLVASLVGYLEAAVAAVGNIDSLDPAFRANIYLVLLDCIKDDNNLKLGYNTTTQALKFLPQSRGKGVWQARVYFMGKLGMDVAVGVHKMKHKDATVQAKMWASLAKSCSNRADQFQFLQKAIECVPNPVHKVEFIVEYAEWLFVNGFPDADAKDNLLMAADILLDLEPEALDMENDARVAASQVGDGGSVASSVSRSSRGSHRSGGSRAGSRARSRVSSYDNEDGRSVASRTSHREGAASQMSNAGSKAAGRSTRMSQHSQRAASTRGGEVLPTELQVQHLLALVRIYTILSMMAPTLEERLRFSLAAHSFLDRIWAATFKAVNEALCVPTEAVPPPTAGSRKGKTQPLEPTTDNSDKKLTNLPTQTQDWISFVVSEQAAYREQMKAMEESPMVINATTVGQPEIAVHYLTILADSLVDAGYHLQALPVLSLVELLAHDVIGVRSLQSVAHLRIAKVLDALNLSAESVARLSLSEPVLPTEEEMLAFREVVEQREQLRAMQEASDAKESNGDGDIDGKKMKMTNKLSKTQALVEGESPLQPPTRVIKGIEPRELWIEIARNLIELGRLPSAKFLLQETRRHALAFDDHFTLATVRRLNGRIAQMEGNMSGSLALEFQAQKYGGDVSFWLEAVKETVAGISAANRAHPQGYQQVLTLQLDVLANATRVFDRLSMREDQSFVDVTRALATLQKMQAEVLLQYESTKYLDTDRSVWYREKATGKAAQSVLVQEKPGDDPTRLFRNVFANLEKSILLFDDLKDEISLVETLRLAGRARVRRCLENFIRVGTPSLMSLTPECQASEQLSVAANLLTRAVEHATSHVRKIKIPALRKDISLPACRELAEAKIELASVYLLMHRQSRPLRRYVSLEPDPEFDDSLSGGLPLDKLQQQIVKAMGKDARDAALSQMFFNKYEDIFGRQAAHAKGRVVTAAQRALAAASTALSHACDDNQKARAMVQLAQAMLLGVTLAVEDAEDTERIEDLNEKARVMKELASMSAEEKEAAAEAEAAAAAAAAAEVAKAAEEEEKKSQRGSRPNSSRAGSPPVSGRKGRETPIMKTPTPPVDQERELLLSQDWSFDRSGWSPRVSQIVASQLAARPKTPLAQQKEKKGKKDKKHDHEEKEEELAPAPDLFEGVVRPQTSAHARITAKAKDLLHRALKIAIVQDMPAVVRTIALELVQLHGAEDPAKVQEFLALAMDADVRAFSGHLYSEAAGDRNPQRLVGKRLEKLGQRRHETSEKATLKRFVQTQSLTHSRTDLITPSLEGEEEQPHPKDMSVSALLQSLETQYRMQLTHVPPNANLLHLHFDPAGPCLYVALHRTAKQGELPMVSRTVLSDDDRDRLFALSMRWDELKTTLHKRIVIYNAYETEYLDSLQREQQTIIDEFSGILTPCFARAMISSHVLSGKGLVVIADRHLFNFPLEALPHFNEAAFVTRDFCLSLLFRRMTGQGMEKPAETNTGRGKKADKGSGAPEANTISTVGYVVDPCKEDVSGKTVAVFEGTKKAAPATLKWDGVSGAEQAPVKGQWQRLLTRNSAFVYLGFEMYLSFVSPEELTGLSCAGTKLAMLMSHGTNEMSHRRQSKADNMRRPIEKEMDSTYCTSLLLSLRGAATVVCNTMSASSTVNNAAFQTIWAGLNGGDTVADALQGWRRMSAWSPTGGPTITKSKGASRSSSRQGSRPGSKMSSRPSTRGKRESVTITEAMPAIKFEEDGRSKLIRLYDKLNTICVGDPTLAVGK